jgi:hypothetical protein
MEVLVLVCTKLTPKLTLWCFFFSLFFLLPDLSVARRILVIGGDWVGHPSNTAARRILVIYPLLAAVSGEGSLEPPGIRMNNFILCPMIIVMRMNNPSSCVQ